MYLVESLPGRDVAPRTKKTNSNNIKVNQITGNEMLNSFPSSLDNRTH